MVDESLEYLILATDGLWDVMRNEVSFVESLFVDYAT